MPEAVPSLKSVKLDRGEAKAILRFFEARKVPALEGFLRRLREIIKSFDDDLERLRELEVVCRSNAFWIEDKGKTATPLIKKIRKSRKYRSHHLMEDENIARPTASELRKRLEEEGKIKSLRGGTNR